MNDCSKNNNSDDRIASLGLNPDSLALFLALLILSFPALFIRLSEAEISCYAVVFNRFWMASVVLGFWVFFSSSKGKEEDDSNKSTTQVNYPYVIGFGILLGAILWWGCLTLWGWSLTHTTLANSTILHNLTPLFTCIGEWLFLRQKAVEVTAVANYNQ